MFVLVRWCRDGHGCPVLSCTLEKPQLQVTRHRTHKAGEVVLATAAPAVVVAAAGRTTKQIPMMMPVADTAWRALGLLGGNDTDIPVSFVRILTGCFNSWVSTARAAAGVVYCCRRGLGERSTCSHSNECASRSMLLLCSG